MMTMRQQSKMIFGLLFTAVAIWASPAVAEDGKLYPGVMCAGSGGLVLTNSPVSSDIRYDSKGGVSIVRPHNEGSGRYVRVSCPIIKDEHKAGKGIARVRVYYTNNHPQLKINCRVEARKNGETVTLGATNTLEKKSHIGPRKTGMLDIPGPQTTHSDGYYYLTCAMPKKTGFGESALHAYYAEER